MASYTPSCVSCREGGLAQEVSLPNQSALSHEDRAAFCRGMFSVAVCGQIMGQGAPQYRSPSLPPLPIAEDARVGERGAGPGNH